MTIEQRLETLERAESRWRRATILLALVLVGIVGAGAMQRDVFVEEIRTKRLILLNAKGQEVGQLDGGVADPKLVLKSATSRTMISATIVGGGSVGSAAINVVGDTGKGTGTAFLSSQGNEVSLRITDSNDESAKLAVGSRMSGLEVLADKSRPAIMLHMNDQRGGEMRLFGKDAKETYLAPR